MNPMLQQELTELLNENERIIKLNAQFKERDRNQWKLIEELQNENKHLKLKSENERLKRLVVK